MKNNPNQRFWHHFVLPLLRDDLKPMTIEEAERELQNMPPCPPMTEEEIERIVEFVMRESRQRGVARGKP